MQVTRSIICEECKLPRKSRQWFDVCDLCVRKLPKVQCGGCPTKVRRLQPDSPFCLQCSRRLSKVKIACEKCGLADYPRISYPGLCGKCYLNAVHRKNVKLRLRKFVCCACGLTKTSLPNAEMICKSCYEKRRTSKGRCTVTGCRGSILHKKLQLCRNHHADRQAPKRLNKYIKNYDSPFPQNVRYFLALTTKLGLADCNVDERGVRARDLCKYRAVGEYLQSHELPEVLTWQVIHEALPKARKRGQQGRMRVHFIRSGLLELGHHILPEQFVQYQRERLMEKWLRSTPVMFVEHVTAFEKWALEGMLNPKLAINLHESQPLANTSEHTHKAIKTVIRFLEWCVKCDICSLTNINESTAASYKETLFWQLECSACRKRIPLNCTKTNEICSNQECQAINSYVKIRRLARASVAQVTVQLRTFFNWAQLHDVVSENPFPYNTEKIRRGFTVMNKRGQMVEIAASIRRYDDKVVERFFFYMTSPDADPEEALILYLIFFHLLTVTELRNAKIPSLAAAENPTGECDRARDFEYLLLPVRQSSRGLQSPRREGPIVKYAKEATCWLRPLLERYFEKRKRIGVSEYLFVGRYQMTQNRPVCDTQILDLVQRASQRVLSGVVNPRDLRGTVAAIRADTSKRRGAILTRLGYTRKWATRFNYLETFLLEPKTTPRRHQSNSASPQRGRSVVSGARCAERASEAGARGRTNKVAGV
jgi:hypothetical protein